MQDRLRLKLVVRRHALPEVRVLFGAVIDNDPTISTLLEQINDVVPLESGEWGLEDYTVEICDKDGQAFECLHFEKVKAILEKDETVL